VLHELEEGIEGLVHISEMSWTRRVKHPSKVVAVGDAVEAVVLDIDAKNNRISLGMKQLEANPYEALAQRYPAGTAVKGRVRNLADFGIFVEIEEGIDGLVHVSDMSWTKRVEHPSEVVQKGQEVGVMVLDVDAENKRIKEVYFSTYAGKYFTGDGARVDEDGDYWLMGRVDDVINVSGHRLGTAEVESALVTHPACAEAAVVGYPHRIKGQGIFAYVFLNDDIRGTADPLELTGALKEQVRHVIGPIATPDEILMVDALPKTRSGKIMRRILRNIAAGEYSDMGNVTTLADPSVVETLIEAHRGMVAAR